MTTEIIQPEKPRKWYEIWWDVWIHPGMAPFKTLLTEPGKNTTRGFIWIAVTSLITGLVSYLFSILVTQNWMSDIFGTQVNNNFGGYALYSALWHHSHPDLRHHRDRLLRCNLPLDCYFLSW